MKNQKALSYNWEQTFETSREIIKYGIKIIGTSFDALTKIEVVFGTFNGVKHSISTIAETADEAAALADTLLPLLIRPSYVLGGQGMKFVIKQELEEHVINLLKTIPGNKLLLDHYLDGAIERSDAICDGENVYIIGIMEHIEPCGVHSGDSNATYHL
jgi:carbamoyl-phosphate synthase large subunit